MTYEGEHLLAGNLGHLFVIVSFVFAALSGIAYFNSSRTPENYLIWIKPARLFFWGHVLSSLTFIIIMFFLLVKHYYEYQYIWQYSSGDMNFRYLLVSFWGGQEGSFMLWIFWHLVLGSILVFSSKKFEPQVMTIFCLVQVFLVSMLLGVYIGDWKLGSSPFALRRMTDPTMGPIWRLIPDYLSFDDGMKTGKGLNVLLRNYWMTIHPPTLFLGFALTVVPFCYAIAGLWTRRLTEWIKPALPWTFFGIMVLGGGILMGGRWAYESLSFGGFWAWDPVENASFVPWIVLVGAGHLMLLNRNNQHSLYSTFILTTFSFILILLSTFLTRSGILGDSSVHSFTGADMMGQLLLYMLFFTWLSIHLLLFDRKLKLYFGIVTLVILLLSVFGNTSMVFGQMAGATISLRSLLFIVGIVSLFLFLIIGYNKTFARETQQEENFSAREFWMFIAAIILCLSAFHIIYNTSIPALNVVFDTKSTIAADERNAFYNMYQVPFAIVVSLIMAFTQFLKYKKTDASKFFREILVAFGLSLVASGIIMQYYVFKFDHAFLLFTSVFAIIANLDYFLRIMKGKLNHLGSSIAHVGFALVLLGSLISQAKQQVISKNYKGYVLNFMTKDGALKNEEDVQLFKGELTSMGDYFVVYTGKTFDDKNGHLYFNVDYLEQLPMMYKKGDRVVHQFQLYECNADHAAAKTFLHESNYWKPITAKSSEEYYSYSTWESHRPGKKSFNLRPFVQLTGSGMAAEPGTQNFWSHDVFTHLKHGNLSPANTGEMDAFKLQANLGDTLKTAGYRIHVAKVEPLSNDTTTQNVKLTLAVYNIWDSEGKYPVLVQPTWEKNDSGGVKHPVAEIKQLGLKFRLLNVNANSIDTTAHNEHMHADNEQKNFEIEYVTKEYVVLHATKFPMIVVLWWGCIIMCFGTLMAVIHRIRKNKVAKA